MNLIKKLSLGIVVVLLTLTSCKKNKVLKSIAGEWKIEDVTENGNSIFNEDNVLNEGTITFEECSSKENKNAMCEAVLKYDLTVLGQDTTYTSSITYRIIEKGEQMLFGDLTMDIVTLEDDKCTLVDNESSTEYTYKLIQ